MHLFGTVIPLPLTSVGFAYGVHENITINSGAYITEALFGVIHLDLGATFGIIKPDGFIPGISVSPTFAFMLDVWQKNFRFYPVVDANLYWNVSERKDIAYLGLSNWFEMATVRADGAPQKNFWMPSLNAGYTFSLNKWLLTAEVRYMGFHLNSKNLVPDYVGIGDNGAIGVYLSAAMLFK
ncbi:MAG: hypothetical protein OEV66_12475 [Spirochaetia bacterium]|nr:hypothetical protein [Spirochaetia bacterium]